MFTESESRPLQFYQSNVVIHVAALPELLVDEEVLYVGLNLRTLLGADVIIPSPDEVGTFGETYQTVSGRKDELIGNNYGSTPMGRFCSAFHTNCCLEERDK